MTQEPPDQVLLVNDAGEPVGMVDMAQLEADSARLCFEYAAAAGDPDELDRIVERWAREVADPSYLGYVSSAALALMTTSVLDPLLVVLDEAAPQFRFREKLREMRDQMGGDG